MGCGGGYGRFGKMSDGLRRVMREVFFFPSSFLSAWNFSNWISELNSAESVLERQ